MTVKGQTATRTDACLLEQSWGRHVYPHRDVKQKPAADEVSGSASRHYQQLSKKDEPDEAYVSMPYADIDDGLGEKRQDELEQASQDQARNDLGKIFPVF